MVQKLSDLERDLVVALLKSFVASFDPADETDQLARRVLHKIDGSGKIVFIRESNEGT